MTNKEQDRIKAYLDDAYARGLVSKRRVHIEMDKYLSFCWVKVTIGGKIETVRFHEGFEVWTPWMTQHDRLAWIAEMVKEGYKMNRIATMLGFSPSTIYKDAKLIRETKSHMLEETPSARLNNRARMRMSIRTYLAAPATLQ